MRTRLLSIAAGAALCGVSQPVLAGALRAGAAKVSITSPASIFPLQLGREKPFVGIHDEVFARAVVLDDGAKRLALVSLELTAVPNPEKIVQAVAAAANVPAENVMVVATNTHGVPLTFYHGGPMVPAIQGELDRVEQGAIQAARDAVAKLQPARIAFARGEAHANMNNGEEANRKGGHDPKASSDKSLDLIRLTGADGRPIALIVNYASHAEVMFRSVTKDGGYETTGDLPGAVSRLLEGPAKAAPVALYTAAAEGDQTSLFKALQPDGILPGTDIGAAGWGVLELIARRIVEAAVTTIKAMPAGASEVRLASAAGALTCPGQKLRRDPASGKITAEASPPANIPLSVLRIGDIAFAGVGADIASNLGRAIKTASPAPNTTVMTKTAGAIGYVLNDAAYRQPEHGALGSPVKPGCASVRLGPAVAALVKSAK